MKKIFLFLVLIPLLTSKVYAAAIDERLGVTNSCGEYPDRTAQGDFMQYGAQKTRELGFAGLELIMIPGSLCSTGGGCYHQADQYCQDGKLNVSDMKSMMQLPQFQAVLTKPIKYFTLYIEAVKKTSIQQSSIHIKTTPYTQAEINSTYTEVKDAIKYLLTRFRGSGKTFYIAPVNELDNRLVQGGCALGQAGNDCDDSDVPQSNVEHAIEFLNMYARAIRDAKTEVPESGMKVYLTCEIARVLSRAMRGKTSSANDVIPYAECDIVAYSAYETYGPMSTDQARQSMIKALNYIAEKAPDHPDFPGGKNVMIGEIGYPEMTDRTDVNIESAEAAIKAAMDWKVVRLNLWTLFDQACSVKPPTKPADCHGFWMIKPDGTKGDIYNYILANYSVSVTPSPPPTGNPADLTNEGDTPGNQVNEYDYNVLVGDFGKTGTPGWIKADIIKNGKVDEFDYNALVGEIGK
ncbi:hypothetical protein A2363_01830 [Candidatus Gottesmanbacteria bacterium RIFOXYB1_FULL_47_11]|uniref:Glycoside hydrolase family 5 domain-containing protein n=1 Tax=Candidatus Gottesmanbacteria bacterium RIFOXYB1_FULL_47_11 TaxID=1798401 RepID=A0A1F6BDA4_9BACT|nr:MAG: hypothetical protein A2363_01830 [Candidatus Gottesmanbacteria bacterium RIFOXYB1_FULL_47_11]